jgi:hypothetical protein
MGRSTAEKIRGRPIGRPLLFDETLTYFTTKVPVIWSGWASQRKK